MDEALDLSGFATRDAVDSCAMQAWYPKFAVLSIPSRIIKLSDEFVAYLNDDGPLYLPDSANPTNSEYRDAEKEDEVYSDGDWSDDGGAGAGSAAGGGGADAAAPGAVKEQKLPSFPKLEATITKHIGKLGGSIYPKLTWSAPRDAAWVATDGTLRCTNAGEIFLLLKASEFVAHDLTSPYEGCPDAPAPPAAGAPALPPPPSEVHLVLRRWQEISTAMEFRCFVNRDELVAVSQRDYTTFYPSMAAIKSEVEGDILSFFQSKIKGNFAGGPDYTFDVYRKSKGNVLLIDFNPFSPVTDALLFTWAELAEMSAVAAASAVARESVCETAEGEGGEDPEDTGDGLLLPNVAGAPCNVDRYQPPAEMRQTSQTDHINKSLLTAFLDRINDPSYVAPTYNDPIGDITADFTDSDTDDEVGGTGTASAGGGGALRAAGSGVEMAAAELPEPGLPVPLPVVSKPASLAAAVDPTPTEINFRIIETKAEARMRPGIYATSRLPKDVVELESATDIETLAKMYRDGKLDPAGHADSSDDDEPPEGSKRHGRTIQQQQQQQEYAALLAAASSAAAVDTAVVGGNGSKAEEGGAAE